MIWLPSPPTNAPRLCQRGDERPDPDEYADWREEARALSAGGMSIRKIALVVHKRQCTVSAALAGTA